MTIKQTSTITTGRRLIDGQIIDNIIKGIWGNAQNNNNTVRAITTGIVAHGGGGQPNAVPLVTDINQVTTVAAAADSVMLPLGVAGNEVTVINGAATNALAVFPPVGGSINGGTVNASVSVAAATLTVFVCTAPLAWYSK
jgi:hypothetical protein